MHHQPKLTPEQVSDMTHVQNVNHRLLRELNFILLDKTTGFTVDVVQHILDDLRARLKLIKSREESLPQKTEDDQTSSTFSYSPYYQESLLTHIAAHAPIEHDIHDEILTYLANESMMGSSHFDQPNLIRIAVYTPERRKLSAPLAGQNISLKFLKAGGVTNPEDGRLFMEAALEHVAYELAEDDYAAALGPLGEFLNHLISGQPHLDERLITEFGIKVVAAALKHAATENET